MKAAGWNWKEILFVALAWISKANLQAALAPALLVYAVNKNLSPTDVNWGLDMLHVTILIILIAAPIGHVTTMLLGPKLLEQNKNDD